MFMDRKLLAEVHTNRIGISGANLSPDCWPAVAVVVAVAAVAVKPSSGMRLRRTPAQGSSLHPSRGLRS